MGMHRSGTGRRRWWLMTGSGLLLGAAASLVMPSTSGCIYHDTCIKVTSPGRDWCANLANALQWPSGGSIEDAEPVIYANGAIPQGCRCFNDADHRILSDEVPACKFDALVAEIDDAARQECQSLVSPGYDHNCWQVSGPTASIVETPFVQPDPGSCIGNCEYGSPPSGGSCPDPNPYECATGDGGGACATLGDPDTDSDDSGGADSTSADSGAGDTSGGFNGGLDADLFVSCDGTSCEIDRAFAEMLYADPTQLLGESARLRYDGMRRRHVLIDVEPGSVAYTMGFRTNDRLESVNGTIIDSLEAALRVYAASGDETVLDVRVMRGTQWLDLHYYIVP